MQTLYEPIQEPSSEVDFEQNPLQQPLLGDNLKKSPNFFSAPNNILSLPGPFKNPIEELRSYHANDIAEQNIQKGVLEISKELSEYKNDTRGIKFKRLRRFLDDCKEGALLELIYKVMIDIAEHYPVDNKKFADYGENIPADNRITTSDGYQWDIHELIEWVINCQQKDPFVNPTTRGVFHLKDKEAILSFAKEKNIPTDKINQNQTRAQQVLQNANAAASLALDVNDAITLPGNWRATWGIPETNTWVLRMADENTQPLLISFSTWPPEWQPVIQKFIRQPNIFSEELIHRLSSAAQATVKAVEEREAKLRGRSSKFDLAWQPIVAISAIATVIIGVSVPTSFQTLGLSKTEAIMATVGIEIMLVLTVFAILYTLKFLDSRAAEAGHGISMATYIANRLGSAGDFPGGGVQTSELEEKNSSNESKDSLTLRGIIQ